MKKYIFTILAAASVMMLASCQEDTLAEQSVITIDKVVTTEFDEWLEENFVNPYNIQFKYRYEEIEADYNYYTIPAYYDMAVKMAHLVKHLCLEAYDEAGGIGFTRRYFPKLIFLIGEWEYKNNGTYILGTAEGGRKITLAGANYLDSSIGSARLLNQRYFKTVHHEFTHILNQTMSLPTDYQFITGNDYVGGEWSNAPYNAGYLKRGFISSYAQESYTEDFAEMLAMYVCYDNDQWDEWLTEAGDGAELILAKLSLVRSYMKETFKIDIDQLKAAIQRRQNDIITGKIDLEDISINK